MSGIGNFARHARILDGVLALVILAGIPALFVFDMYAPRGELDGVGYAALVALSIRFGDRALIACASFTTLATLLASLGVPDYGISVAGMWANRGFAILEIWIVTAILLNRLRLEAWIGDRESKLMVYQTAVSRIINEVLHSDKPMDEQIRVITELSAEAPQVDFCALLRRPDEKSLVRVINIWDRQSRRHYVLPDVPANSTPRFRETMRRERYVHTDDVLISQDHQGHLDFFAKVNIRAVLSAQTIHEPGLGVVMFGFREPHRWTSAEIAFALGAANLVALFFAVHRSSETLAALEQVGEGIYVEDRDGSLRYANRAARSLPENDLPANSVRPAAAFAGSGDMHELTHRGRTLEVQRLGLPDGGVLTRINDVTERNAVLEQRRKLDERLQRGAKMEAIGQLAGGVAHDFNNILGAILGFGSFLTQDLPSKTEQHGFAVRIVNACERGKALVDQIMAFARLRSVERGVADLGLVVKNNQDFLAGLLPPQVMLEIDRAGMALPVLGSSVQINQLITNLLINARDSLPVTGGAIRLTVRPAAPEELIWGEDERHERLWGEVQPDHAYGLLRVEDQGSGIAPEILDRIFEPFFTTKGRRQGTGLGLAVVHGVVQSLNGICHVRSVPGGGTVFSVYFPLAGGEGLAAEPANAPPADLHGKGRVLIVDDEVDVADMLSIGLARLGYETVSINDPREALAAFQEDPEAFDILITDQIMLGMRGLELIRSLKKIKPGLIAVLCTGFGEGTNEEIAREAGADLFFRKPVELHQIAANMRQITGRVMKKG